MRLDYILSEKKEHDGCIAAPVSPGRPLTPRNRAEPCLFPLSRPFPTGTASHRAPRAHGRPALPRATAAPRPRPARSSRGGAPLSAPAGGSRAPAAGGLRSRRDGGRCRPRAQPRPAEPCAWGAPPAFLRGPGRRDTAAPYPSPSPGERGLPEVSLSRRGPVSGRRSRCRWSAGGAVPSGGRRSLR